MRTHTLKRGDTGDYYWIALGVEHVDIKQSRLPVWLSVLKDRKARLDTLSGFVIGLSMSRPQGFVNEEGSAEYNGMSWEYFTDLEPLNLAWGKTAPRM